MAVIQNANKIDDALRRSWRNAGAPTDGTSGTLAGVAAPGDLLIDTTNTKLYQNINTKASPTWGQVAVAGVTVTGDFSISGDITLGTEDISVVQGRAVYLDGQDGGEYIKSDAADELMINATTTMNLAIGGTDEVHLTSSALSPATSDGNALGTASLMWADLFLASGGVINFNNGDMTITHSANALTIAGGDLAFSGAANAHFLNFDSVTLDKTIIGVSSYSSPIDQSCTTGLVGFASTSDDADSWRYSAGLYIKGTGSGTKVMGLGLQSEYNGTDGADRLFGMSSIAYLGGGGEAARLLTNPDIGGMYAGWFKVTAPVAGVVDSGSRVAALWVDNQMNCVCNGEEYAFFITCGGSKVDAVFGFETTSSGWTHLFSFDETAYDQDPVSALVCDTDGGDSNGSLKIALNGVTKYIPYFDSAS